MQVLYDNRVRWFELPYIRLIWHPLARAINYISPKFSIDSIVHADSDSCFNRNLQHQRSQHNQRNQRNQSMQIKKIKDYLSKAIKPYDKGNKYLKKVSEFVMWVHNINLCF